MGPHIGNNCEPLDRETFLPFDHKRAGFHFPCMHVMINDKNNINVQGLPASTGFRFFCSTFVEYYRPVIFYFRDLCVCVCVFKKIKSETNE